MRTKGMTYEAPTAKSYDPSIVKKLPKNSAFIGVSVSVAFFKWEPVKNKKGEFSYLVIPGSWWHSEALSGPLPNGQWLGFDEASKKILEVLREKYNDEVRQTKKTKP